MKLHVIRLNPLPICVLSFSRTGPASTLRPVPALETISSDLMTARKKAILSDAYPIHTFEIEGTAEHLLEDCLENAQF